MIAKSLSSPKRKSSYGSYLTFSKNDVNKRKKGLQGLSVSRSAMTFPW
uniref:Uncharacterized protein n=1 Tax=Rhizophora mucronata TaxID=61149 RepID=A0A2P2NP58_RHIMU